MILGCACTDGKFLEENRKICPYVVLVVLQASTCHWSQLYIICMEQVLWTLLPTKAGPGSMCYWFRQILHRNKVNIQGSTGLWSGPLHRALFPNGPPERIPGYQKISLQHDIRDELSLISFDRTEGVTPGACSPDYLLPAALSCLDVLRKLMLVETESLLVFF